MAGWTARALARQTGVPATTVALWISNGLVTPEHYGRGRGGHIIGVSGLLEFIAVVELREAGFSGQAVRRAVDNLRQLSGYERPLARLTLLVNGKDIVWKDAHDLDGVTLSALHQPGQRLMVFPVGEKHAELLRQLEIHQPIGPAPKSKLVSGKPLSHVS